MHDENRDVMIDTKKKPLQEESIFESLRGLGRDAFDRVSTSAYQRAKDGIERKTDLTFREIYTIKSTVESGYKIVEETVGKDRIIGAAGGAKFGAFLVAKNYHSRNVRDAAIAGLIGTTVGGIVGFLAGPEFIRRLNKAEEQMNNKNSSPNKPSEPNP